ncbi:MAG: hypothetical protein HC890_15495 [Chloroflexaceae bacterium]|nr:hypothetical protein [Chloroflexaceae bacterium]
MPVTPFFSKVTMAAFWYLTPILAQNLGELKEIDIITQLQDAFNNFIETGQVWALLIGLFLGYLVRSLTAY